MNAYIVYTPGRKNTEVVYAVFAEVEKAQECARAQRQRLIDKGWESWANKVRICQPKDHNFAIEVANELVRQGNFLDMASQGGTFRGDSKSIAANNMDFLYHCASILNKAVKDDKAKQLTKAN